MYDRRKFNKVHVSITYYTGSKLIKNSACFRLEDGNGNEPLGHSFRIYENVSSSSMLRVTKLLTLIKIENQLAVHAGEHVSFWFTWRRKS